MSEKGGISVQTQHIFPVIKKWLYSEKDIFLREVVSNASDAITKVKHLSAIGEAKNIDGDFVIKVIIDKEQGTLTVTDNGIGMSEEEVKKYLNQIALSGALDFVEKYDTGKSEDGIIGHFGLGFYSSFMVSDTVTVKTKSFTDAPAVEWVCTADGEYEMNPCDKSDRGTEVIMKVTEDEKEYLSREKISPILDKFCAFMPYPIYLEVVGEAPQEKKETNEAGEEVVTVVEPKPINDTEPLWQKNPSQCTTEEYNEFYHKVFMDYKEPLFHIHINADYPLNFKGILYFPRISHEYQNLEGQVKLFYNRVFVADNIKEVIPEYLLMLKGVLDCPELPLNVSRSYLQNSQYVSKISAHIVKKVCDKLNALYNTDRENYEKFWDDIKTFVEYACMRDKKFYDKVKDVILYKTITSEKTEYLTIKEYLEKAGTDKKVYYASDVTQQALYINMFKAQNVPVIIFDHRMDNQFITALEQYENGMKFSRIDAETDAIKNETEESKNEAFEKLFKDVAGNERMNVSFSELKDASVPAILTVSEESRRFEEMLKLYRMAHEGEEDTFASRPLDSTLVLNTSNSLIKKLLGKNTESESTKEIAKQIYTLSLIGQRQLTAKELSDFLSNSFSLLEKLDIE